MTKPNFQQMFKTVQTAMTKYSPEILTGIGVAGLITTSIMVGTGTVKAIPKIDRAKKEKHRDNEPFTAVDAVKTTWTCYVPAIVTGSISVACIIGASSVNAKRNTALATAYKLSETAFTEYREKVVQTIGDKKEQAVKDQVAKDYVDRNPVTRSEVIITGKGDTLCLDTCFGNYFDSDIEKIKKAINELNRRMMSEMYISLNDFYSELGIRTIDIGYDLGWNMDDGMIDIDFSSALADNGKPCLTMTYRIKPRYDFSRLM